MGEPLRADDIKYTYADILSWTGNTRWELIDGIAYDMTPAPTRRHQEISRALFRQIDRFLAGAACQIFYAPFDVRLPNAGEDAASATTVVQPDLVVICNPEQLDERGCVGSPTLIIEILSPTTFNKDLREKLRVYQHAGVPEYWIVWPEERIIMVFTLNEHHVYGAPTVYVGEEQLPVGVLPGLVIDLPGVFTT